jgi:hypothetical protein
MAMGKRYGIDAMVVGKAMDTEPKNLRIGSSVLMSASEVDAELERRERGFRGFAQAMLGNARRYPATCHYRRIATERYGMGRLGKAMSAMSQANLRSRRMLRFVCGSIMDNGTLSQAPRLIAHKSTQAMRQSNRLMNTKTIGES